MYLNNLKNATELLINDATTATQTIHAVTLAPGRPTNQSIEDDKATTNTGKRASESIVLDISRSSDSGKSSSCSPTLLDCSFDSGIAGVLLDSNNMQLHKQIQQCQRIILALERDREHFCTIRNRLSKITERKKKRLNDSEYFCNVCCAEIDPEDCKTYVKCYICQKHICRSIKCADWLAKTAQWECELCQTSKESMAQTSSWVAEQISFNQEKCVYPIRARSEIFIPISECNDSSIHFESVSQIGANSAVVTAEQKLKIREYVEEVVATLLGGNLDTISINQLSKSENYLNLFDKYHSKLSNILINWENVLTFHIFNKGDLPAPKSTGPFCQQNGSVLEKNCETSQAVTPISGNVPDFTHMSENRLRQMILKIIAETKNVPSLSTTDAVSEISLDRLCKAGENMPPTNGHRHRTEHYFEPTIYQDLLATAVLNKIVDKQFNSHDNSERLPNLTRGEDDCDINVVLDENFNVEHHSTTSGSSVEPRSDCSYTDMEQILNTNDDKSLETNIFNADRESVMSDYLAYHMVPLPNLSEMATESEEDDYLSVTSSAVGDGTWENNWLFKKKKSTLGGTVAATSIGMLVPDPKDDVRAKIGDKTADEVSDLSELGSDTDDSLDVLRSKLDPINDRLINKHLIGGQNSKEVLDELIERSSMISNILPTDLEQAFTETCNEHVIDAAIKSQAINVDVNQQQHSYNTEQESSEFIPVPAGFDDLNSNPLTASDDFTESDSCTGFSTIEIVEQTVRTPSVIEILAAMALGPMLAVPAIDQPTALTDSEITTLNELKDLALAEIKARFVELTPHSLSAIPEEPGEHVIDIKCIPTSDEIIAGIANKFENSLVTSLNVSPFTLDSEETVIETIFKSTIQSITDDTFITSESSVNNEIKSTEKPYLGHSEKPETANTDGSITIQPEEKSALTRKDDENCDIATLNQTKSFLLRADENTPYLSKSTPTDILQSFKSINPLREENKICETECLEGSNAQYSYNFIPTKSAPSDAEMLQKTTRSLMETPSSEGLEFDTKPLCDMPVTQHTEELSLPQMFKDVFDATALDCSTPDEQPMKHLTNEQTKNTVMESSISEIEKNKSFEISILKCSKSNNIHITGDYIEEQSENKNILPSATNYEDFIPQSTLILPTEKDDILPKKDNSSSTTEIQIETSGESNVSNAKYDITGTVKLSEIKQLDTQNIKALNLANKENFTPTYISEDLTYLRVTTIPKPNETVPLEVIKSDNVSSEVSTVVQNEQSVPLESKISKNFNLQGSDNVAAANTKDEIAPSDDLKSQIDDKNEFTDHSSVGTAIHEYSEYIPTETGILQYTEDKINDSTNRQCLKSEIQTTDNSTPKIVDTNITQSIQNDKIYTASQPESYFENQIINPSDGFECITQLAELKNKFSDTTADKDLNTATLESVKLITKNRDESFLAPTNNNSNKTEYSHLDNEPTKKYTNPETDTIIDKSIKSAVQQTENDFIQSEPSDPTDDSADDHVSITKAKQTDDILLESTFTKISKYDSLSTVDKYRTIALMENIIGETEPSDPNESVSQLGGTALKGNIIFATSTTVELNDESSSQITEKQLAIESYSVLSQNKTCAIIQDNYTVAGENVILQVAPQKGSEFSAEPYEIIDVGFKNHNDNVMFKNKTQLSGQSSPVLADFITDMQTMQETRKVQADNTVSAIDPLIRECFHNDAQSSWESNSISTKSHTKDLENCIHPTRESISVTEERQISEATLSENEIRINKQSIEALTEKLPQTLHSEGIESFTQPSETVPSEFCLLNMEPKEEYTEAITIQTSISIPIAKQPKENSKEPTMEHAILQIFDSNIYETVTQPLTEYIPVPQQDDEIYKTNHSQCSLSDKDKVEQSNEANTEISIPGNVNGNKVQPITQPWMELIPFAKDETAFTECVVSAVQLAETNPQISFSEDSKCINLSEVPEKSTFTEQALSNRKPFERNTEENKLLLVTTENIISETTYLEGIESVNLTTTESITESNMETSITEFSNSETIGSVILTNVCSSQVPNDDQIYQPKVPTQLSVENIPIPKDILIFETTPKECICLNKLQVEKELTENSITQTTCLETDYKIPEAALKLNIEELIVAQKDEKISAIEISICSLSDMKQAEETILSETESLADSMSIAQLNNKYIFPDTHNSETTSSKCLKYEIQQTKESKSTISAVESERTTLIKGNTTAISTDNSNIALLQISINENNMPEGKDDKAFKETLQPFIEESTKALILNSICSEANDSVIEPYSENLLTEPDKLSSKSTTEASTDTLKSTMSVTSPMADSMCSDENVSVLEACSSENLLPEPAKLCSKSTTEKSLDTLKPTTSEPKPLADSICSDEYVYVLEASTENLLAEPAQLCSKSSTEESTDILKNTMSETAPMADSICTDENISVLEISSSENLLSEPAILDMSDTEEFNISFKNTISENAPLVGSICSDENISVLEASSFENFLSQPTKPDMINTEESSVILKITMSETASLAASISGDENVNVLEAFSSENLLSEPTKPYDSKCSVLDTSNTEESAVTFKKTMSETTPLADDCISDVNTSVFEAISSENFLSASANLTPPFDSLSNVIGTKESTAILRKPPTETAPMSDSIRSDENIYDLEASTSENLLSEPAKTYNLKSSVLDMSDTEESAVTLKKTKSESAPLADSICSYENVSLSNVIDTEESTVTLKDPPSETAFTAESICSDENISVLEASSSHNLLSEPATSDMSDTKETNVTLKNTMSETTPLADSNSSDENISLSNVIDTEESTVTLKDTPSETAFTAESICSDENISVLEALSSHNLLSEPAKSDMSNTEESNVTLKNCMSETAFTAESICSDENISVLEPSSSHNLLSEPAKSEMSDTEESNVTLKNSMSETVSMVDSICSDENILLSNVIDTEESTVTLKDTPSETASMAESICSDENISVLEAPSSHNPLSEPAKSDMSDTEESNVIFNNTISETTPLADSICSDDNISILEASLSENLLSQPNKSDMSDTEESNVTLKNSMSETVSMAESICSDENISVLEASLSDNLLSKPAKSDTSDTEESNVTLKNTMSETTPLADSISSDENISLSNAIDTEESTVILKDTPSETSSMAEAICSDENISVLEASSSDYLLSEPAKSDMSDTEESNVTLKNTMSETTPLADSISSDENISLSNVIDTEESTVTLKDTPSETAFTAESICSDENISVLEATLSHNLLSEPAKSDMSHTEESNVTFKNTVSETTPLADSVNSDENISLSNVIDTEESTVTLKNTPSVTVSMAEAICSDENISVLEASSSDNLLSEPAKSDMSDTEESNVTFKNTVSETTPLADSVNSDENISLSNVIDTEESTVTLKNTPSVTVSMAESICSDENISVLEATLSHNLLSEPAKSDMSHTEESNVTFKNTVSETTPLADSVNSDENISLSNVIDTEESTVTLKNTPSVTVSMAEALCSDENISVLEASSSDNLLSEPAKSDMSDTEESNVTLKNTMSETTPLANSISSDENISLSNVIDTEESTVTLKDTPSETAFTAESICSDENISVLEATLSHNLLSEPAKSDMRHTEESNVTFKNTVSETTPLADSVSSDENISLSNVIDTEESTVTLKNTPSVTVSMAEAICSDENISVLEASSSDNLLSEPAKSDMSDTEESNVTLKNTMSETTPLADSISSDENISLSNVIDTEESTVTLKDTPSETASMAESICSDENISVLEASSSYNLLSEPAKSDMSDTEESNVTLKNTMSETTPLADSISSDENISLSNVIDTEESTVTLKDTPSETAYTAESICSDENISVLEASSSHNLLSEPAKSDMSDTEESNVTLKNSMSETVSMAESICSDENISVLEASSSDNLLSEPAKSDMSDTEESNVTLKNSMSETVSMAESICSDENIYVLEASLSDNLLSKPAKSDMSDTEESNVTLKNTMSETTPLADSISSHENISLSNVIDTEKSTVTLKDTPSETASMAESICSDENISVLEASLSHNLLSEPAKSDMSDTEESNVTLKNTMSETTPLADSISSDENVSLSNVIDTEESTVILKDTPSETAYTAESICSDENISVLEASSSHNLLSEPAKSDMSDTEESNVTLKNTMSETTPLADSISSHENISLSNVIDTEKSTVTLKDTPSETASMAESICSDENISVLEASLSHNLLSEPAKSDMSDTEESNVTLKNTMSETTPLADSISSHENISLSNVIDTEKSTVTLKDTPSETASMAESICSDENISVLEASLSHNLLSEPAKSDMSDTEESNVTLKNTMSETTPLADSISSDENVSLSNVIDTEESTVTLKDTPSETAYTAESICSDENISVLEASSSHNLLSEPAKSDMSDTEESNVTLKNSMSETVSMAESICSDENISVLEASSSDNLLSEPAKSDMSDTEESNVTLKNSMSETVSMAESICSDENIYVLEASLSDNLLSKPAKSDMSDTEESNVTLKNTMSETTPLADSISSHENISLSNVIDTEKSTVTLKDTPSETASMAESICSDENISVLEASLSHNLLSEPAKSDMSDTEESNVTLKNTMSETTPLADSICSDENISVLVASSSDNLLSQPTKSDMSYTEESNVTLKNTMSETTPLADSISSDENVSLSNVIDTEESTVILKDTLSETASMAEAICSDENISVLVASSSDNLLSEPAEESNVTLKNTMSETTPLADSICSDENISVLEATLSDNLLSEPAKTYDSKCSLSGMSDMEESTVTLKNKMSETAPLADSVCSDKNISVLETSSSENILPESSILCSYSTMEKSTDTLNAITSETAPLTDSIDITQSYSEEKVFSVTNEFIIKENIEASKDVQIFETENFKCSLLDTKKTGEFTVPLHNTTSENAAWRDSIYLTQPNNEGNISLFETSSFENLQAEAAELKPPYESTDSTASSFTTESNPSKQQNSDMTINAGPTTILSDSVPFPISTILGFEASQLSSTPPPKVSNDLISGSIENHTTNISAEEQDSLDKTISPTLTRQPTVVEIRPAVAGLADNINDTSSYVKSPSLDHLISDTNHNEGSRTTTVKEYIGKCPNESDILANKFKISPPSTTTNTHTKTITKQKQKPTYDMHHLKSINGTVIHKRNKHKRSQKQSNNFLLTSAVQNQEHIYNRRINNRREDDADDDSVGVEIDLIEDHDEEEVDDDDDEVAILRHFVPGSIAEREYKKWNNAVEMPNNPYAPEALKRRISGSQERFIDLPNISPTQEQNPMEILNKNKLNVDESDQREQDYKRYSRDYYINNGGPSSQTSPARETNATPNKAILETEQKITAIDLYKAIPAQVVEDTISQQSIESENTTTSDDSDTIRIYDFKKQSTTVIKDENTQEVEGCAKAEVTPQVRPIQALTLSRLECGGNVATPARGSTPTAFKFLQPKRKLLDPSQVLSVDEEESTAVTGPIEKAAIEKDVVQALPSVKALAKAFLMTARAAQSENRWIRKAKTLSQGVKKPSTDSTCLEAAKVEEDVTITSDLSSLETDTSSVYKETENTKDISPSSPSEDNNSASVLRQGGLKNNIAFFENLKFK